MQRLSNFDEATALALCSGGQRSQASFDSLCKHATTNPGPSANSEGKKMAGQKNESAWGHAFIVRRFGILRSEESSQTSAAQHLLVLNVPVLNLLRASPRRGGRSIYRMTFHRMIGSRSAGLGGQENWGQEDGAVTAGDSECACRVLAEQVAETAPGAAR